MRCVTFWVPAAPKCHSPRQKIPVAGTRWVAGPIATAEPVAGTPMAGRRVPEIGRDDIREVVQRTRRTVCGAGGDRLETLTIPKCQTYCSGGSGEVVEDPLDVVVLLQRVDQGQDLVGLILRQLNRRLGDVLGFRGDEGQLSLLDRRL